MMALKKNSTLTLAALAGLVFTTAPVRAALLVYEGFQYETATSASDRTGASLVHGQADDPGGSDTDASGLGGTWAEQLSGSVNTTTDLRMATGSLLFGDLPVSGNHARADSNLNNDILTRSITSNLGGSPKLWFSVLASKLDRRGAAQGGLVIGNQAVNNSKVLLDTGSTGLNGFAVASPSGGNWAAYGWDGAAQTVGSSLGIPNADVHLLVGEITFDVGTGAELGFDEFNLYDYALGGSGTIAGGGLGSPVSSILVDVDQSGLDTFSIARQVNTAYDEIRIGTTLDDVLGVPEPSTAILLGLGGLAMLRRRR